MHRPKTDAFQAWLKRSDNTSPLYQPREGGKEV